MNYKNVLVLGFGVTGQAIVNFLTEKGVNHTVVDSKPEAKFDQALIKKYQKTESENSGLTEFIFGVNDFDKIEDYDLVLTSPGVSYLHNPILQKALAKNIPIKNDVTLFLEEWKKFGKTIGVTGSNGKSTIVTLIHQMIVATGENSILVGNIGKSPLDYLITESAPGTIAVIELSSYQLESFKPEHAVEVAILANLTSNHLDHYDGDFQKYADAKIKIAQPQRTKLIVNLDNEETNKYLGEKLKEYKNNLYPVSLKTDASEAYQDGAYSNAQGNIFIQANHDIEFDYIKGLKISGQHNLYNIAMAILAFDLIGLEYNERIEKAIRNFSGLEHRLEFIREFEGVKFINDSKSTTPDSTRAAIESFNQDKNIVLIMGGDDKDMNFKVLAPYLEQYVKELVLLPGSALEKILNLSELAEVNCETVPDMQSAVLKARELAEVGDVVLLSPSSSSLNMFNNFEHRGTEFKKFVNELI
jgi:UDP-N-acetylmuramoylalanine--D-glutamate ligase